MVAKETLDLLSRGTEGKFETLFASIVLFVFGAYCGEKLLAFPLDPGLQPMWSAFLVLALAAAPDAETESTFPAIRAQAQTGSLLFSQGDCLAVKVFTGSPLTHVGMIIVENGEPVVYDAMNGTGVRKTPLDEYLHFLVPSKVQVLHPMSNLSEPDRTALVDHLDSQLGRPYRIHHHATGKRCDGVHCAEYMTDALIAANVLTANEPSRVSPGSLYVGVIDGRLYRPGGEYSFREAKPPIPSNETRCQRYWRQTGECCSGCCNQLSRWFLCREKSS